MMVAKCTVNAPVIYALRCSAQFRGNCFCWRQCDWFGSVNIEYREVRRERLNAEDDLMGSLCWCFSRSIVLLITVTTGTPHVCVTRTAVHGYIVLLDYCTVKKTGIISRIVVWCRVWTRWPLTVTRVIHGKSGSAQWLVRLGRKGGGVAQTIEKCLLTSVSCDVHVYVASSKQQWRLTECLPRQA